MAKTEQVLSIFLASPGDVSGERDGVDAFVGEWNDLWSGEVGVHLRLVRWETHAYPAVGADGQDVINAQIGEEYDVFVGIMWKRFGTPRGGLHQAPSRNSNAPCGDIGQAETRS